MTWSPTGHDLARVVDVLPRELGNVDQAVHAAEVDEGTEVDDRRNDTLSDLARLQVGQELVALGALGLFQVGPAGKHHVVAVLVQLDDLRLELPADVRLQVADPAQLDQGRRQEPTQPDVQDQAALDHLDGRAPHGAVALLHGLDRPPGPLVLGPLLGQHEPAFLVLFLQDQGLDLVAHLDHVVGVDVVADGQLPGRDHALGLEADVEQDLVLVDLDDRAGHDVAVVELDDRPGNGVFEGRTAEVVGNDLAGVYAPGLVESAHLGPETAFVGGSSGTGRRGEVGHRFRTSLALGIGMREWGSAPRMLHLRSRRLFAPPQYRLPGDFDLVGAA